MYGRNDVLCIIVILMICIFCASCAYDGGADDSGFVGYGGASAFGLVREIDSAVAAVVSAGNGCAGMAEALEGWMYAGGRDGRAADLRTEFDSGCTAGQTSSIPCMSSFLLAQSEMDYAIGGCMSEMNESVSKFNVMFGLYVGGLNDDAN